MLRLTSRAGPPAGHTSLLRKAGAAPRRTRALPTTRRASPAPTIAGGQTLLAGLLESIIQVAQAHYGYCVVADDSRLDIVLRHGIGAREALESLFRDSPLAVEAALTQGASTLPARGARCLPVDLGPRTRGALVLYPRSDAGTIGALETELLAALIEQFGMALSVTRAQQLLAQLQAAVSADLSLS
jgi:hypothetical protein